MKDENLTQPLSNDPVPEEEPWVSKEEILKLFDVTDRQLVHWRANDKIIYKTVKNRTFYKASTVRSQIEKTNRPKKSWWVKKRSIFTYKEIILAILIPIVGVWFLLATPPFLKGKVYTLADINQAFIYILSIPGAFLLVISIIYFWKKYFRKKDPKD